MYSHGLKFSLRDVLNFLATPSGLFSFLVDTAEEAPDHGDDTQGVPWEEAEEEEERVRGALERFQRETTQNEPWKHDVKTHKILIEV